MTNPTVFFVFLPSDFYCIRKPLAERVDKELKLWTNKNTCIIIKATDNRKTHTYSCIASTQNERFGVSQFSSLTIYAWKYFTDKNSMKGIEKALKIRYNN